MRTVLILLSLLCGTPIISAHTASTAYLWLSTEIQTGHLRGEWHVALRDLVRLMPLDINQDKIISGRELKAQSLLIQKTLSPTLKIEHCTIQMQDVLVDTHLGETYAVLRFKACINTLIPHSLTVHYHALFPQDNLHRAILYWKDTPYLLSPKQTQQNLDLNPSAKTNRWQILSTYIQQGIWHIWIGFDHWLFLLTLLLPAVLNYQRPNWQAVEQFKPALIELLKIVTAFTIAHSLTLSFTVLSSFNIPIYGVESLIALSVILVALNNLYPIINQRRWALAFGFGLLHGFGFASALLELGLSQNSLGLSLLGFNLGVELGQLTIVFIYFPLAYVLRNTQIYQWFFLRIGSGFVALLATIWLFERIFNVPFTVY